MTAHFSAILLSSQYAIPELSYLPPPPLPLILSVSFSLSLSLSHFLSYFLSLVFSLIFSSHFLFSFSLISFSPSRSLFSLFPSLSPSPSHIFTRLLAYLFNFLIQLKDHYLVLSCYSIQYYYGMVYYVILY